MNPYVDILMKLCQKAEKNCDIPVAAIVEYNGRIIGKGYNTREKNQSILGHAEINAIKKASKHLNNWNLEGCNIYVTLKPCSMCLEVIKQSRISNVFYIIDKDENKLEYDKTKIIKINSANNINFKHHLSNFFEEIREKKR